MHNLACSMLSNRVACPLRARALAPWPPRFARRGAAATGYCHRALHARLTIETLEIAFGLIDHFIDGQLAPGRQFRIRRCQHAFEKGVDCRGFLRTLIGFGACVLFGEGKTQRNNAGDGEDQHDAGHRCGQQAMPSDEARCPIHPGQPSRHDGPMIADALQVIGPGVRTGITLLALAGQRFMITVSRSPRGRTQMDMWRRVVAQDVGASKIVEVFRADAAGTRQSFIGKHAQRMTSLRARAAAVAGSCSALMWQGAQDLAILGQPARRLRANGNAEIDTFTWPASSTRSCRA